MNAVTRIIAERTLIAIEDGREVEVRVVIGQPERFTEGNGYYCPFQITGTGSGRVKYAGGVDSVQSLQLAMKMIGVILACTGKAIKWPLSDEGTGFEA